MTIHKNEVYYADLSPVVGSEQGGTRPVLIIQNDKIARRPHGAKLHGQPRAEESN